MSHPEEKTLPSRQRFQPFIKLSIEENTALYCIELQSILK